jgi:hypothetical protein
VAQGRYVQQRRRDGQPLDREPLPVAQRRFKRSCGQASRAFLARQLADDFEVNDRWGGEVRGLDRPSGRPCPGPVYQQVNGD